MQSFKEYIISEFKEIPFIAAEFKFNHSEKNTFDKKSNTVNKKHNILVNIKLYNQDLKLLRSENIKFTNDKLAKVSEKKLVNIDPNELNKRFAVAKEEIIKFICMTIQSKIDELTSKINSIKGYDSEEKTVSKTKYDM